MTAHWPADKVPGLIAAHPAQPRSSSSFNAYRMRSRSASANRLAQLCERRNKNNVAIGRVATRDPAGASPHKAEQGQRRGPLMKTGWWAFRDQVGEVDGKVNLLTWRVGGLYGVLVVLGAPALLCCYA